MNTAKISGSWFARLQVINCEGETLSGSLIKEKAGSAEPVQELVPKLTNNEFCPSKVRLIRIVMSKVID